VLAVMEERSDPVLGGTTIDGGLGRPLLPGIVVLVEGGSVTLAIVVVGQTIPVEPADCVVLVIGITVIVTAAWPEVTVVVVSVDIL